MENRGEAAIFVAAANRQEALDALQRLAGGDMLHTSRESETAFGGVWRANPGGPCCRPL